MNDTSCKRDPSNYHAWKCIYYKHNLELEISIYNFYIIRFFQVPSHVHIIHQSINIAEPKVMRIRNEINSAKHRIIKIKNKKKLGGTKWNAAKKNRTTTWFPIDKSFSCVDIDRSFGEPVTRLKLHLRSFSPVSLTPLCACWMAEDRRASRK